MGRATVLRVADLVDADTDSIRAWADALLGRSAAYHVAATRAGSVFTVERVGRFGIVGRTCALAGLTAALSQVKVCAEGGPLSTSARGPGRVTHSPLRYERVTRLLKYWMGGKLDVRYESHGMRHQLLDRPALTNGGIVDFHT